MLAAVNLLPIADITDYKKVCDKLKEIFKLQPETYAVRFKEA
jgi:hypothetical protein